MDDARDDDADTIPVTFSVSNARRIDSRLLFALVDVEVRIAGVAFDILGVQARRLPEGGTVVRLPTFKDEGGIWCPAIRLPEEVRTPLADAVLAFLMEEGLARRKFAPAVGPDLRVGSFNCQPDGVLVSIQEPLEFLQWVVVHRIGVMRRLCLCGHARTAVAMTAASCATPVT